MIDAETFPVLVCHRDALVQAGLIATLSAEPELEVMSAVGADSVATRLRQRRGTGLVVADYESGLEVLQAWRRAAVLGMPAIPAVLIVSWRDTEAEIRRALEAGARGYLIGDCQLVDLLDGVRALRRGGRFLGEAVAHSVAESLTRIRLTMRETEVLGLMAIGCPNKTIAARLDIAIGTVKAHTKAILAKLDASSRTEATVIAKQRGLLSCSAATPMPVRCIPAPRSQPGGASRVSVLSA
jgi:DNA-binding NarL/FixJ family response regulator